MLDVWSMFKYKMQEVRHGTAIILCANVIFISVSITPYDSSHYTEYDKTRLQLLSSLDRNITLQRNSGTPLIASCHTVLMSSTSYLVLQVLSTYTT
jgi:hypothetical protein